MSWWRRIVKPEVREYVAGFAFSSGQSYVALVRKQKPEWQKGLLNGVGGKVEHDELPLEAMYREFKEECTLPVRRWEHFATVEGGGDQPWRVYFYWTHIVDDRFRPATNYGKEAEHVEVFPIKWLGGGKFSTIPNLAWLIPLAVAHMHGHATVTVREEDGRL